jgi:hypothetical protein
MLRNKDITISQDSHHDGDDDKIEVGAKFLFKLLDESTVILVDVVLITAS